MARGRGRRKDRDDTTAHYHDPDIYSIRAANERNIREDAYWRRILTEQQGVLSEGQLERLRRKKPTVRRVIIKSPVRETRLRTKLAVSPKWLAKAPHHESRNEVVRCLKHIVKRYAQKMNPGAGAGRVLKKLRPRNDVRREVFQAARKAC